MLIERWARFIRAVGLSTFLSWATSASAGPNVQIGQAEDPEAEEELIPLQVAGPFEFPWSFGFLPNGSILVTEKPGRLRLVTPEASPRTVKGLPPVRPGDHGGLLDVAIDPAFNRTGLIYLSYTHETRAGSTIRVLRARLNVEKAKLVERAVLFESDPPATANEMLGGRLTLVGEHLFLTLGDRQEPSRAQDLSDHAGSIVRIRTDGSIPPTNPFVSVPGAKPEIWSFGHRNPQGLAADNETGRIWASEHGPLGGDELNVIQPGRNYGWPLVSHGLNYDDSPVGSGERSAPGIEPPLHFWSPSIAPSGLTLRRDGERVSLWSGALAGQRVVQLEILGDKILREQHFLEGKLGRIRDVRAGPDGFLYAITDDPEGALYRLAPITEEARKGSARPRL